MISYTEALKTIFDHLPLPDAQVKKLTRAKGYFLAEDVKSDTELPMFTNSAMDGYAVLSRDTLTIPTTLQIIGKIPAGRPFRSKLKPGQTVYIATGGAVPEGADAVVPIEDTIGVDPHKVRILKTARKDDHIRFAGEEIKRGETVLWKHTELGSAQLGMLASIGRNSVKVFRKPEIAFLATGDELIDPAQTPQDGQIRNSNAIVIGSMAKDLGFRFRDLGMAGDHAASIQGKFKDTKLPEVLITSAGVSMGIYDIVADVLKSLGLKVLFWKVAIKPGKPLVFGMIGKTVYFGLPGNPVSAAVVYKLLVEPALLALAGSKKPFAMMFPAKSESTIKATAGRVHFARGICFYDDGWRVKGTGKQGSHIFSSMVNANCLISIPPNKELKPGDKVMVQLLEGMRMDYDTALKAFSEL